MSDLPFPLFVGARRNTKTTKSRVHQSFRDFVFRGNLLQSRINVDFLGLQTRFCTDMWISRGYQPDFVQILIYDCAGFPVSGSWFSCMWQLYRRRVKYTSGRCVGKKTDHYVRLRSFTLMNAFNDAPYEAGSMVRSA